MCVGSKAVSDRQLACLPHHCMRYNSFSFSTLALRCFQPNGSTSLLESAKVSGLYNRAHSQSNIYVTYAPSHLSILSILMPWTLLSLQKFHAHHCQDLLECHNLMLLHLLRISGTIRLVEHKLFEGGKNISLGHNLHE